MRVHASVIRGPSLYRHECRKCAEETLHNAHGCCRCGTSPWTTRKARMREAITDRHLADAICGKRGEKVETFRAVYQRVYGEAL